MRTTDLLSVGKATLLGKSMKELILEALEATYGSESGAPGERREIKK